MVCRVTTVVPHSTVVLQRVDLAAAVAVADAIVTPVMIGAGHALLVVATDVTTTVAATVVANTHGDIAGTEAAIGVVLQAGHHRNQRTSKSS